MENIKKMIMKKTLIIILVILNVFLLLSCSGEVIIEETITNDTEIIENNLENYILNYDGTIKNELSNKLKKYRRQISLDKHVPEFGIFNNKELNLIVSSQPKNLNDLEKIGVSKYTTNNYGEAIINIITHN